MATRKTHTDTHTHTHLKKHRDAAPPVVAARTRRRPTKGPWSNRRRGPDATCGTGNFSDAECFQTDQQRLNDPIDCPIGTPVGS